MEKIRRTSLLFSKDIIVSANSFLFVSKPAFFKKNCQNFQSSSFQGSVLIWRNQQLYLTEVSFSTGVVKTSYFIHLGRILIKNFLWKTLNPLKSSAKKIGTTNYWLFLTFSFQIWSSARFFVPVTWKRFSTIISMGLKLSLQSHHFFVQKNLFSTLLPSFTSLLISVKKPCILFSNSCISLKNVSLQFSPKSWWQSNGRVYFKSYSTE